MHRSERLYSFPKVERLLKRREFLAISRQGRRFAGNHFTIIALERPVDGVRIGITASRKVGGAVIRNRIKRFVRECFRLNKEWFSPADYSIIARSSAAGLDFSAVCRDLQRALQQFQVRHG